MTSYTEDDLRVALAEEAVSTPPPTDVWPTLRRRVTVRRWRHAAYATGVVGAVAAVFLVTLSGLDNPTRLSIATSPSTTWVPDRALTGAELKAAADTVRHRLEAIGAVDATVQAQDGALVLRAPHVPAATVNGLFARGIVQFRPVYAMQAPGAHALRPPDVAAATLTLAEQTYASAACPPPTAVNVAAGSSASTYLIACSTDTAEEYLLGPAALSNADIREANADQDPQTQDWLVQLGFTSSGSDTWQSFTAHTATKPDLGDCAPPQGCNAIGVLVDGSVLSAPRVQQPGGIRGGQVQLTGALTKQQAQLLAADAAAAPLPAGFSRSNS